MRQPEIIVRRQRPHGAPSARLRPYTTECCMCVRSFCILPSFAARALPALGIAMACGVSNAVAQTDRYSRMAAIGQYLMEESAEMQLARSAAPISISGDATILVLDGRATRQPFKARTDLSAWWPEVGWLRSTGPNSGTRR